MRLYARTLLGEDVHLTKEEGYKIQIAVMKDHLLKIYKNQMQIRKLKKNLKNSGKRCQNINTM